jgi:hypothetical protein
MSKKAETAFTEEQKDQAAALQQDIAQLLESNRLHKLNLDTNFVQIGALLDSIRTAQYWRIWGFKNFSAYMKSMESRTQNYHCLGVARDLLPLISMEDLVAMGISKASVLRLMVKGDKPITPELVALARDKTKEELEAAVAQELGLVEDDTPGKWFSFGGAKMLDEEREEFLHAVNLVALAADLGGEQIVNWQEVPSQRKKEIFRWMCADFISGAGLDILVQPEVVAA